MAAGAEVMLVTLTLLIMRYAEVAPYRRPKQLHYDDPLKYQVKAADLSSTVT